MQCSFAFFCLAIAFGVVSTYPLPFRTTTFSGGDTLPVGNEDYTDVTSKKQLWRFAVGNGDGYTVGERFVCLRVNNRAGRLIGASSTTVYQESSCRDNARLEVEFLTGNEVKLRTKRGNRYLSCADDGRVRVTTWSDETSIFQLRINSDEDSLILYNPYYDGALSAEGYTITCNGYRAETLSKFRGWKLGPKEAWEASDEWQMIGSFDNRYSASKMKFTYGTVIGIETTLAGKASVPDGVRVEIGPDMFETFTKSIASKSDVAWQSTPPNVWRHTEWLTSHIEVEPKRMTKIYQAIGRYGVFIIRTNYMQARDDDAYVAFSNLME